jgi:hypothetical protein
MTDWNIPGEYRFKGAELEAMAGSILYIHCIHGRLYTVHTLYTGQGV